MFRRDAFFFIILSIIAVFPLSAQQKERKTTPSEKPGNTARNSISVVVASVKLTIDRATLADSYDGVESYSAKSRDETLLVIHLRLSGGTSSDAFRDLMKKCHVVDEKNVKTAAAQDEPEYKKAPGDSAYKFSGGLWIFSVPKSSRSFKLVLPENRIVKLDALLASSKHQK